MCSSVTKGEPMGRQTSEIDMTLILEVEKISDEDDMRKCMGLIGTYRTAMVEYRNRGDECFRNVALEAEADLRRQLGSLRDRQVNVPKEACCQGCTGHKWECRDRLVKEISGQ